METEEIRKEKRERGEIEQKERKIKDAEEKSKLN